MYVLQLPDEACTIAAIQLDTLTGIVKGLTRSTSGDDGGLILLEDDDPELLRQQEEVIQAREQTELVTLRNNILTAIAGCVDRYGGHAEVAQVLLFFCRAYERLIFFSRSAICLKQ
jgi:hypothetical protein